MKKLHLLSIVGLLFVFTCPFLTFSQTVSDSAKSVFLKDLDSARAGDSDAQLRVAHAYNQGRVVWRNASEAVWWFQQASDQGSMEATAWLGALLLFGGDVPQDVPNATALLQRAVDADNPIGLRFMGAKYQAGIGTAKDPAKAVEFFSRAIALNDPESHSRLGRMYLGGLGVSKDPEKAFELFTAGSKLGDQWSQLNLGQMYEQGSIPKSSGALANIAKPDHLRARQLFAASAAQGNRVAQYELARMYDLGLGTPRNYSKSFEYYKQSSMQRYPPALVELGKAHEFGHGTAVNLLHAHVAYSQAIDYSHGSLGVKELHNVESKLTPADVHKAHEMLKTFQQASEAAFARSFR